MKPLSFNLKGNLVTLIYKQKEKTKNPLCEILWFFPFNGIEVIIV